MKPKLQAVLFFERAANLLENARKVQQMTYPRHAQVSLAATPFYHVVSRCVRRAWLWGYDSYSSKDYNHRKAWVLDRLRKLAGVFAIDCSAYAILSNHFHLVVHINKERAEAWTTEEVIFRWSQIFGIPKVIERAQLPEASEAEKIIAAELIELWRKRLYDISWHMRCLNEFLARKANEEDECTGRFWEGRFKCQALLDEAGLLTAMAYVDLNPVRAGIVDTPEESDFTSIYARIREMKNSEEKPPVPLQPFRDDVNTAEADYPRLPFNLTDYLQLVDWAGKQIRYPHKAVMDPALPPILTRLGINATAWSVTMHRSGNRFGRAIGTIKNLRAHAKALKQSWIAGLTLSKKAFGTG